MSTLEELVTWITDRGGDSEKQWTVYQWKEALNKAVPNWKDLVGASDSWDAISKTYPKSRYCRELYSMIVDICGIRLAKQWFYSNKDDQRSAAEDWIANNLSHWSYFDKNMKTYAIETYDFCKKMDLRIWNKLTTPMKQLLIKEHPGDFLGIMNINYWNNLGEDLKIELILNIVKKYPGEPYGTFTKYQRHDDINSKVFFSFIPVFDRYVPSLEIEQLQLITQIANDIKMMSIIEKIIEQRSRHFGNIKFLMSEITSQRRIYLPDRNEQELIARLIDKTCSCGFLPTVIPDIVISVEPPPLFVLNPELEDELPDFRDIDMVYDEHGNFIEECECGLYSMYHPIMEEMTREILQHEEKAFPVRRDRKRKTPEDFSIENLIGCYIPRANEIRIFKRGIDFCVKKYDFDEYYLRAVVLMHGFAHYITHLLPKHGIPTWNTDLYILSDIEVHEGFAQLMTYWIADDIKGEFQSTFDKLNQMQPAPYHIFKQFTDIPFLNIMKSLESLRLKTSLVRFEDWKKVLNMI